ncbi:MAG: hypothetical protein ACRD9Q_04965 [Nitrososphaeraceae archaeon]
MNFGRRKDGRVYPKRPRMNIDFSDAEDPPKRNQNSFSYWDNVRRRNELEEFAWKRKEEWEKNEKERIKRKKEERFERLAHVELGNAKILLISAVPFIISSDPTLTLSTIYTGVKFAKFSYHFITELDQEYKETGSLEKALLNVTLQGLGQQVFSKLKEISIKTVSEAASKSIWDYYKEKNQSFKIPIDWNRHVENAMARTFEEVLNKVI